MQSKPRRSGTLGSIVHLYEDFLIMLVSEQSLSNSVSNSGTNVGLPDPGLLPGPLSPKPLPNPGLPNVIASRQEIAFIDGQIQDYQKLLPGIRRGIEVVILDPTLSGMDQITEILANQTELSAIHLISYGDTGKIYLGKSQLSLGNLANNSDKLAVWQRSLLPGADVLLYGSNIAAEEMGSQFLHELSQKLGADVAASNNTTGKASLKGDWKLEVQTAPLATSLAIRTSVLQSYNYTLTAPPALQAWKDVEPTPPIVPPASLIEAPALTPEAVPTPPPALETPPVPPTPPATLPVDSPNLSSELPDPGLALPPQPPAPLQVIQGNIPELPATGDLPPTV